jgi:hypothetical protein
VSETTYEAATRCPKCDKPGDVTIREPARNLPPGTQLHTVYCRTPLCPWNDTCWFVQVNPDGTVPPPTDHTGAPKQYERFEGHDALAAQVQDSIRRQQRAETGGGGEIRG